MRTAIVDIAADLKLVVIDNLREAAVRARIAAGEVGEWVKTRVE